MKKLGQRLLEWKRKINVWIICYRWVGGTNVTEKNNEWRNK